MTRNLETLIEQFNRFKELDRVSQAQTGKIYWLEIEGVYTNLVTVWQAELSQEEKTILESKVDTS